ncbi:MAG: cytochrome c oxidase subunit II [Gemmatimonadota bacterium]
MDWGFPESASTFGAQIDAAYGAIFYATALAFVIVQGLLIYCIIRYRHRTGRKAKPIHGNTRLEIIWTVVPALGVFYIAYVSASVWLDMKSEDRIPAGAYEVGVHASQFEWTVTNPGMDGRLGSDDDFVTRNQLHIPMGQPVRVLLTAEDVIHSFFLPNFRVKQDAVPGMQIAVWFEPTTAGEYPLGCAELCGLGHYRMRGTVTVHSPDEFDAWQVSEGAVAADIAETNTVASR